MQAPPPATLATLVVLGVIHAGVKTSGRTHGAVGLSVAACLTGHDPARAITAQLVHLDTFHFVLNALALSSVGAAGEAAVGGGLLRYAAATVELLAGTAALTLAGLATLARLPLLWTRLWPAAGPPPAWMDAAADRAARTSIVGYSGVIFGWFAIAALASHGRVPFIGGSTLPAICGPFLTLIATAVILPQSSFLGHLAGLLSGIAVYTVGLAWLTPSLVLTVVAWAGAIAWAQHQAGGGGGGGWSWPRFGGGGGGEDGGDGDAEAGGQRAGLLDAASAEARAAAAAAAMARAAGNGR
jgi:membrane associated rhomboid family serine protease